MQLVGGGGGCQSAKTIGILQAYLGWISRPANAKLQLKRIRISMKKPEEYRVASSWFTILLVWINRKFVYTLTLLLIQGNGQTFHLGYIISSYLGCFLLYFLVWLKVQHTGRNLCLLRNKNYYLKKFFSNHVTRK